MLKILKILAETTTVLLALMGLFWLPKDMEEWKQAAAPWKRGLAAIDLTTILLITVILLVLWLLWNDVRPYIAGLFNRYNRPVRGGYPARLSFKFDPQSGHVRRTENIGIERYYVLSEATKSRIFIVFTKDTGTENVHVTCNDGTPFSYEILDRSARSVIVEVSGRLNQAGYTIDVENPLDSNT